MKIATLLLFAIFAARASALQVGDTFTVFSQRQTPGPGLGVGYVYTYIKSPSGVYHYDNDFRPYAASDGYHASQVELDEPGVWMHYTASASSGGTNAATKPDSVDRSEPFTVNPKPPTPTKPKVNVSGSSGTASVR